MGYVLVRLRWSMREWRRRKYATIQPVEDFTEHRGSFVIVRCI